MLIDASLLFALFTPSDPQRQAASTFLQHARSEYSAGRAELFASDLAIEECVHRILTIRLAVEIRRGVHASSQAVFASRQRMGSVPITKHFDVSWLLKIDPAAIRAHVHLVSRFIRNVRAADIVIVEPDMIGDPGFSLVDRMRDCIQNYDLRPADAYHVAVATAIGASTVVSLDRDWHRLQGDFAVVSIP